MYKILKKNFGWYLLELIIAIVLYNFSLKAFLIYAFFWIIIKIDITTDYLRKVIRTFQVMNELKLLAIVKKLDIKEEELDKLVEEMNSKLTDEQRKDLDEDFAELGFYLVGLRK